MGLGSVLGKIGSGIASIASPVGAIAGAVGAVAGAFSSGSSQTSSSGYTLPPELELQMFQQFHQTQSGLEQYRQQIGSAMNALQAKLDTLNQAIGGTLPAADATKMLAQHNSDLASSLGMSAEEMVKNGFMTEDDAKTLTQMRSLTDQGNIFEDPQLKNQLQDQRRQLDQQLAQQGASPAMRAQALSQFDRQAQEQMFSRSQELKTSQSNLLSQQLQSSLGARQAGFNQALQGYQAGQSQLGFVQNTLGQQAGLSNQGFQAGLQGAQAGSSLAQNQFGNYQQLGTFKFSNTAKNLLSSGAIGPGSVYGQTGIPGSQTGGYAKNIGRQENAAYARAGGNAINTANKYASAFGANGLVRPDNQNLINQQASIFQPNSNYRWLLNS